jgi:hypothetical protein
MTWKQGKKKCYKKNVPIWSRKRKKQIPGIRTKGKHHKKNTII